MATNTKNYEELNINIFKGNIQKHSLIFICELTWKDLTIKINIYISAII
jgi:hypothetical protein